MRIGKRLSVSMFDIDVLFNPKFYRLTMLPDGWSLLVGPLWIRWWPERKVT
jgi:hypothetical protein